jgi:filamentous hemagglutinin family protein
LKAGGSSAALAVALALSGHAAAGSLPAHGHFVSGHGSIGKANQSLTVKQSSTNGIIDWKTFSIGKHDGVTFDNGSGATLNRVTGGNLSTIAGHLHATGTLYLMNSSGVVISGAGRVVTGGSFVASSGSIGNDAFENGKRHIKNGHAAIVNHGAIVAAHGVRLVGGDVSNTGSIEASRIKLWSRHKLDIGGTLTAQRERGEGGAVIAHGHAIYVSGRINASADAANESGGTIVIHARDTTTINGKLIAKGGDHGTGGLVETSGEHVHVANSAWVSTHTYHGETGTWLIDPDDLVVSQFEI